MKFEIEIDVQEVVDQMGWPEFCKNAQLEFWLRAERWESLKLLIGVTINGNIEQTFDVNLLHIVEEEIESIEIDKSDQEDVDDYLEAMKIIKDQIIKIENIPRL